MHFGKTYGHSNCVKITDIIAIVNVQKQRTTIECHILYRYQKRSKVETPIRNIM